MHLITFLRISYGNISENFARLGNLSEQRDSFHSILCFIWRREMLEAASTTLSYYAKVNNPWFLPLYFIYIYIYFLMKSNARRGAPEWISKDPCITEKKGKLIKWEGGGVGICEPGFWRFEDCKCDNLKNLFEKFFILPRVAELFIHKDKQKEVVLCLVQINIHTYISNILHVYIYYLFVWDYSF